MHIKTAIVILNWNGQRFLKKFLPDVIRYSSHCAEVIVADNASTDDSVAYLRSTFPQVRIIQNKENEGFAKGYNDALRQIDSEYVCLLNSDINVTPHWIEPVVTLMDEDPNIAACQPKIRSYAEPDKFEYAGAAGGFIDQFGYPFCRGRVFNHLEADHGQYDDDIEVFWATGACLFLRTAAFRQVDGFDVDFFAHMEEIDLCWRLKQLDYKIMYCGSATVYHVGGGTLPKQSSRKTFLNFRNNGMMLIKNLPSGNLPLVLGVRLLLDGVAGMRFLLGGSAADFVAVIKAHMHIYRSFRTLINKRELLPCKPVPHIYKGSLVVNHYLKGIKSYMDIPDRPQDSPVRT